MCRDGKQKELSLGEPRVKLRFVVLKRKRKKKKKTKKTNYNSLSANV